MKKLTILIFLVCSLLLVASVSAKTGSSQLSESKYDSAVDNYLIGVKSENFGLKTSSAYYLGEMESSEAVIPLLRILNNDDEDVRTRITAALALYKIGDGRGIFRLKTTAKFDDNKRLADLSERFYLAYKLKELGFDQEISEESLQEYVQNTALPEMFN